MKELIRWEHGGETWRLVSENGVTRFEKQGRAALDKWYRCLITEDAESLIGLIVSQVVKS